MPRSSAGFLSSDRSFLLPRGRHVGTAGGRPRGYPIDLSVKAQEPRWKEAWRGDPGAQLHVVLIQHGLGSYERYLGGDGDEWLETMLATARHLAKVQLKAVRQAGGYPHRTPFPHSYRLVPPWLSAMAQGQAASLLIRAHIETGEEEFAESALASLAPFGVRSREGGVLATLGGGPFLEEYPTTTAGSFVLNGAIFAIWGVLDVERVMSQSGPVSSAELLGTLGRNLHRWDNGHWSRYDLYPHPVPNVASSFYHLLHMNQLEELSASHPDLTSFAQYAAQFRDYRDARHDRLWAFCGKAAFRVLVPRNATLARALPWSPLRGTRQAAPSSTST
jgi:heparosan-N-sulfate-glucuronate 5-epimerase